MEIIVLEHTENLFLTDFKVSDEKSIVNTELIGRLGYGNT